MWRASGLIAIVLVTCAVVLAEPGPGRGAGHGSPWSTGRGRDSAHDADQALFPRLLRARERIRRSVTEIPNGVRTVTESEDAETAATIRAHVHAMHRRLVEGRPIHRRDPLFDAIFAHAHAIGMTVEDTAAGVRVVQTSTEAWVVELIRAHADVVSRFLEYGHEEVRRNHAVPPHPSAP